MKWNFKTIFLLICLNTTSVAANLSTSFPQTWASVEYLHWWSEDSPINAPLVTQNNNLAALGKIGEPGTQIIFGAGGSNNRLNLGAANGARITIGKWLQPSQQFGLEGSGFELGDAKKTFSASSVGGTIPVINIPFFDTQNAIENALIDHHPNTATISDSVQPWGLELNGLFNVSDRAHFPLIFLAGFRYINIAEDFTLNDAITELPGFSNSIVNLRDHFATQNNFYGLQAGARTHYIYQHFIFDVSVSVTVGENFQRLKINGELNQNNNTVLQSIGLFAEPSNTGSFYQHQLAIVPELRAKVGYQLNSSIHPFIAYNFFYISNLLRPSAQIDRNINKSQNPGLGGTGVLSGPAKPATQFNSSGMWIQGLSAGVEVDF